MVLQVALEAFAFWGMAGNAVRWCELECMRSLQDHSRVDVLCCCSALPAGVCVQSLATGGKVLLDPSSDEAFREEAGMLLAMMPTANEVSSGWLL